MKLYAAVYNESDGYTYGYEMYLGVFDERSKADECILLEVESGQYKWRKLEEYEIKEFELNEYWD